MTSVSRLPLIGAILVSSACVQSQDAELCAAAAEHVQECFPERQVEEPDECDAAVAEQTLGQSCEALSEQKADHVCNPFLWWLCGWTPQPTSYDVSFTVESCPSIQCDIVHGGGRCALVTVEDAAGNVLAQGLTDVFGYILFEDLELAAGQEYFTKLYRADGTIGVQMIEEEFMTGKTGTAPTVASIVPGEEEKVRVRMYVDEATVDAYPRCH